jgi:hypothetical protein
VRFNVAVFVTPSTRPRGDEDVLQMLSGAKFGPKVTLTLPSGKAIDGDEVQVWTVFYSDRDNRPEPHAHDPQF